MEVKLLVAVFLNVLLMWVLQLFFAPSFLKGKDKPLSISKAILWVCCCRWSLCVKSLNQFWWFLANQFSNFREGAEEENKVPELQGQLVESEAAGGF